MSAGASRCELADASLPMTCFECGDLSISPALLRDLPSATIDQEQKVCVTACP